MRRKRGKAKDHNHDAIPNAGRNGEDIRPNGETEGGSRSGGEIALPATRSAGQERLEDSSFPKADIDGQVPPDIYLNFPFQPSFEGLGIAYIAGSVCLGATPRIVPQNVGSEWRIEKIKRLALDCPLSLHDLSPVSGGRLNMAWELGVVMGATESLKHEWFILAKDRHRLQRSLSNLNGVDPHQHGGTEHGVLSALHRIFGRAELTPKLLRSVLAKVKKAYRKFRVEGYGSFYEDRNCFNKLVQAATLSLAEELRRRRRS